MILVFGVLYGANKWQNEKGLSPGIERESSAGGHNLGLMPPSSSPDLLKERAYCGKRDQYYE